MKIITLTTLYTDPTTSVPPGTEVELDAAEAQSLIDRGLAELPFVSAPEMDAGLAAAAEAEAEAKPAKK